MALAFTMLVPWGCGDEGEQFDPPSRVTIPDEAIEFSFGVALDSTDLESLHWPWLAALSESRRFLAIDDRSPPFIRVVDRTADTAWSFGPEGEGPGELASPAAIDFLGDSVLLVLSRGRLERFTTSGNWLGGERLVDETGLRVFSATVACGDRIFVYAVPDGRRDGGDLPWLHELDLGEEVTTTPRLTIRGPGFPGYTGLMGLEGTAEGVLLWHKFGSPESGYWLPCAGGEPSLWSVGAGDAQSATSSGSVMILPDTSYSGIAVRDSVGIWAREALEPDDGVEITSFYVASGAECSEVEIRGSWNLLDAYEDGLVVTTTQPFPVVRIVDWSWFERSLTRVDCRR